MAQYSQRTQPMHRLKEWLKLMDREDLIENDEKKFQNIRVCSIHFEAKMFKNKRLQSNAVPSLHLPKQVESLAGSEYKPTLWYYEHMKFLSGKTDEKSDDDQSDYDDDEETSDILQPGKKRRASESIEPGPSKTPTSLNEVSAMAFGQSIGAQLYHLSKQQRCIAEKLISDVIYHGKMEQLPMNAFINLNREESTSQSIETNDIIIPETEPSWYEKANNIESKQGPVSVTLVTNVETEPNLHQESQDAVNCIKTEFEDLTNESYDTQDLNEQENADLKEEDQEE